VKARLQDWLITQAERRPEAPAIVFHGRPTSYGALEQASNRLARALRAAGCVQGDRVALLLPKSPQALVAMFGVLKADCIYVPIDTSSPPARIERIVQLCECRCLLAEQSTAGLVNQLAATDKAASSARIIWMDSGASLPSLKAPFFWDDVETLCGAPVDSRNSDADPAHILFTSGSTGVPKGVVITHSNVIHFVRWAVQYFGMGPNDRVSGHPPLHFDLSTFDIYGSIAAGAQIHLLPPEVSLLPHRLADFIRDSELTQWFSVPSALLPIAKFDVLRPHDFPALRRLLWCGEKFPVPALTYWMRRLPRVSFVNLYGPTETTIASSYYRVPQCPVDDQAEIPIGGACDGEALLVLNDQLSPALPGEIGDLYISGVGLSPGYWKDPAKTADVFRLNPHSSNRADRIYKTGDLAKIGRDGLIYLVGRSDSQIKSRGYRIELGEIEAALHAIPDLQDAAVVALDFAGADAKTICCAYVPPPGRELTPTALKGRLARVLPRYMIPERWLILKSMPHNGNGKADRTLLKEMFHREAGTNGAAASPSAIQRRETTIRTLLHAG
jgi:amino acid adenylation domain-containing protein